MKKLIALFTAVAAVVAGTGVSYGQTEYPGRPVKIVVGFAAGGLNDVLARLIAQKLTPVMGQPFFVENRPGAGANIAAEYVARSDPDGYTLLLSSSALAINPAITPKLTYDAQKDFAPIIRITTTKMLIMVNPSVPASNLRELISLAKSNPGKLNYASAGPGSPIHLASEMFKYAAGIDIVHIPYKGSTPSLTAAVAGEVQVLVDVMPTAIPLIKSGKLKPIAVASEKRSAALPDVPTAGEAGLPGFVATSWNGVLAPAKTPSAVITRLNTEIAKIMVSDDIKRRVLELGAEGETSTPQEFATFLRDETVKWARAVSAAGIKVQ
jgi:tripartite-type tricarboxylate transporter receptor subunit TctC